MKKHQEVMLSEQEIGRAYAETLRFVSMSRGMISDETRQRMADAIRQFYHSLETRIEAKRSLYDSVTNESLKMKRAPSSRNQQAHVAAASSKAR